MTIRGTVYDPEAHFLGKPAAVAGAQVYLAEDDHFAAQADDDGSFAISDVPANFNWHPIAIYDPTYLRTLDGLGTPVTEKDLADYAVPILRRDGLPTILAEYFGVSPENLDSIGLLVAAIMDERPLSGAYLRENLSVAVGGDPCRVETWAFVTHDGEKFAVEAVPSGTPPQNWTGLLALTGPLGCIVSVVVRDLIGIQNFLPHDMAVDNRAALFQVYVPQ